MKLNRTEPGKYAILWSAILSCGCMRLFDRVPALKPRVGQLAICFTHCRIVEVEIIDD